MDKMALEQKLNDLCAMTPKQEDFLSSPQAKALVIDLSAEKSFDWEIPTEYLESFVSGPALAASLWAKFVGPTVNLPSSYEADNPIVFAASAMANSGMPGGELTSCAFKSPVTNSLTFNIATNSVGMRLDSLGYAALILIGRFRRPTIIDIKKSGVFFSTSEAFIGFSVSQVEHFMDTSAMKTAISIGVAGELKVPFSIAVCEGSSFGRGGLGSVFGFKNIKAIGITGFSPFVKGEAVDKEPNSEKKVAFAKLLKACDESRFCMEMREKGSSYLVSYASRYGWAPIDNFRYRTDPRLFHLSGDETKRRFGTSHSTCIGCPMMCKHLTQNGFSLPGYESLLMLGSNVGCFDTSTIIERHALCLDLGLDPVSVGNVLGWIKQAKEQALIDFLDDSFSFSNNADVLPLIEMIAKRVGLGEPLSFGSLALGKAFGGEDFSYTIRGLECGPVDYRGAFSQSISDVLGFGFQNQFEIFSNLCVKDFSQWAVFNEDISLGLASYGVLPALVLPTVVDCTKWNFLSLKMFKILPKTVIKHLKPTILANCIAAVLKRPVDGDDVFHLGERCWLLVYEINKALGFDMLSDSVCNNSSNGSNDSNDNNDNNGLPTYFCIDPNSNSKDDSIVPFFDLMQSYCRIRKQAIVNKISKFNSN